MTELEILRRDNTLHQRKIGAQRGELARLYADNGALSALMSWLFKENWELKKKAEAEEDQKIRADAAPSHS